MCMKKVIAVIGSDIPDTHLAHDTFTIAEELGKEIARHHAVLLCGGRGGVMEAACKGAKSQQGTTIGILPDSKVEANPYVDIALPTGLGTRRNYLVVNMSDAVIAVGGSWGTLNEMSFAGILVKPLILIKGTGGSVDLLCESYLIREKHDKAVVTAAPKEAVEAALSFL